MNAAELANYLADSPPSTVKLEIKKHFEALNDKQKHYAHYISRAAFTGTRITLRQVSPESELIYDLIITLHKANNGEWADLAKKAGVSEEDLKHFLDYSAQFLGNCGNYKGFGDAKFIPRCPEEAIKKLAETDEKAKKLYELIDGRVYATKNQAEMHLGYPDEGHMSTYYPDTQPITKAEIGAVSKWMEKMKILPENTRLRKDERGIFELRIASGNTKPSDVEEREPWAKQKSYTIEDGELTGKTIEITFGDYAMEMRKITDYHNLAKMYAENENQAKMQDAYAESFETGSLNAFKDAQRFWIRDKGPMVESNIGFVETYRDPHGVRGEWEGFAATVNLERTAAFQGLVNAAETEIPKLPWSKEFEKDKFLSPDFTSLEVLSFAGSGIPAGINIPNYDDIRQTEGFKNVSLGNVLSAKAPNEKIPFIAEKDLEIYQKYRDAAFEVQVGVHELLGHGTGKLLQETAPGVFNFDTSSPPISPITNKPVETYYKPGQTWGSVFGAIAASYEECRAETVAMALSCESSILKIFGFDIGSTTGGQLDMNSQAGDVLYAAYLSMARAGIASLELWDPKSQKWGQAHSQARYSILKCFLDAGEEFCKLSYTKEDLSDLAISLNRDLILTTGRKAVEEYLMKLHVYKSTADVVNGTKLYEDMTRVDPEFWGSKVREQVLEQKQPRKVFVQANTVIEGETVRLVEYEPSVEGMIKSYVERDV